MSNLYLIMCKTKIRNVENTEGKSGEKSGEKSGNVVEGKSGNQEEKFGISCFLVPIETKGLSFGANEKYVRYGCYSFYTLILLIFVLL